MKSGAKAKILEEDLYKPVRDYLVKEGYIVRSEVKDCDVVAVRQDEMVIVELKRSMNLDLVLQGTERQKITEAVYLAVPRPDGSMYTTRWKSTYSLLKRLGLGLMMVSIREDASWVEVVFHPDFNIKDKGLKAGKKVKGKIMTEIQGRHMDLNTGGSCRKKLMTAYRESSIHIACFLKKLGPLTAKDLRALGTDSKKTLPILTDNHYGWFEKISRGTYALSELGEEELGTFSDIVEYYNKKVDENIRTVK